MTIRVPRRSAQYIGVYVSNTSGTQDSLSGQSPQSSHCRDWFPRRLLSRLTFMRRRTCIFVRTPSCLPGDLPNARCASPIADSFFRSVVWLLSRCGIVSSLSVSLPPNLRLLAMQYSGVSCQDSSIESNRIESTLSIWPDQRAHDY